MRNRCSVFVLLGLVMVAAGCSRDGRTEAAPPDQEPAPNTLTAEERAEGWELLFNGRDLSGWRGFRRDDVPGGWRVGDGTLHFAPGVEGGDIMTEAEFADFELALEWKVSEGGNSGIMYRVTEEEDGAWKTGAEMQVLDDAGHRDGQNPLTAAGSNYALHARSADVVRPVGEWNAVRILADGPHVEYWLNGTRVVEFELWSDEWEALVAASKFVEHPRYGRAAAGHIDLQDHGDPVWYRNIKIRRLNP